MSAQTQAAAGDTVERFLADPTIQGAIAKLHERYYTEFRTAKTIEDREKVHSKSRVLDDFAGELMSVINAGKIAKVKIEQDELAERQRSGRNQRSR